MERLRFCMITTFYPPYAFGGDAVFVQRLSNLLARRGHEVDVIHCVDSYRALAGGLPAAGHSADEPGVTVHRLRSGAGVLSPLATYETGYPLFKGRALRRILAAKRFDVIHFHNISLIGGPMLLRYGEGLKLYTLHEHWLVCPTHVLFKYRREPCIRPSCFRCTLVHRRPPQLWRYTGLLRRALRHVDCFIAPSAFARQRHLAAGLDLPIVELPHCVGPSTAGPTARGDLAGAPPLPDRPYFLFVGRLEKLKGLQTLIPLFREYRAADLVVAGEGAYRPALAELARGVPGIRFLGRLAPAELEAAYARAVALVVPSITFETFGQVVVEAFAARTPAVVRDLGALPELVARSGGGLVYRDQAELRAALERLQADPALRDRLGQAGYQAYRREWSEEVHAERYLDLVAELRAGRRAPVLSR
jgi:glycosyltransferase involved in cell wall biosynthesis